MQIAESLSHSPQILEKHNTIKYMGKKLHDHYKNLDFYLHIFCLLILCVGKSSDYLYIFIWNV